MTMRFREALTAFQGGDMPGAKSRLAALLTTEPRHADGHHLAALIARQEGRWLQALEHFAASLDSNRGQPIVLSNLGNLLRDLRRDAEAEAHYAEALALLPTLVDTWYHRGVLATETYRFDLAIECFEQALSLKAEARSFIALGRAQLARNAAAGADAKETASRMRRQFPQDARGVALQARALLQAGEHDEAIATLHAALPTVEDTAALHYELGLIARDRQDLEGARTELTRATSLRPEFIEAHRALNQLLWEQQDEAFLRSWHEALKLRPNHAPLYHNLAAAYIASGAEAEATRTLEFAVERLGRDPFLLHGLGVQASKHGNLGIAQAFYDEALAVVPDSVRFLIDRATLAIRCAEYVEGETRLERALQIAPHHQEVWAYRGLLWRLAGDTRHDWLNDYDGFLKDLELPTPQGYRNISEFMAEVAALLNSRHTSNRQPLDQSVRNGTQTTGVLLEDPHPLLRTLRSGIETATREYLGQLSADRQHPFLQRWHGRWRFSGSWSVRLGSAGFHTDHVHPYGWLSCCTYVALPDCIDEADAEQRGWIRFGTSALALPDREHLARTIRPRVGHCVFFPGYFWHGTVPFTSAQTRLTVPCDFEPN